MTRKSFDSGSPWGRRFLFARAGVAAVEFALLLPVLVLLLYGIFAASWVLTIEHGMQQLASEAARSAVAGLNDSERDGLARTYVTSQVGTYAFMNPSALTVSTSTSDPTLSFTVTTSYDLSTSPLCSFFLRFLPLPSTVVTRSATIREGGF
jgi:Flp pilus assembly protein TadG